MDVALGSYVGKEMATSSWPDGYAMSNDEAQSPSDPADSSEDKKESIGGQGNGEKQRHDGKANDAIRVANGPEH
jgi:hypothetical protein